MPCALDCLNEHSLVPGACSRDSLGNNASLLGDESLKLLFVLVIDVHVFVFAKAADAFLSDLRSPLVHAAALGSSALPRAAALLHAASAALRSARLK